MTTPMPTVGQSWSADAKAVDATCCACGDVRPLRELLIVTDRRDLGRPPWYCCRPALEGRRRDCLRSASGPAVDYSIALAVPEPPLLPHPLPERPAPAPVRPSRPGRLVIAHNATLADGPWWSDRAASR